MLSRLLGHADAAQFQITALVRSAESAQRLRDATGIEVVVGSHSDLDVVEALASKASVILSMVCTARGVETHLIAVDRPIAMISNSPRLN